MADFSYQALLGSLGQQQQPQSLWQGISQGDSIPQLQPGAVSPLAQMMLKQQLQQDPRAFMPTIDPGRSWGGKDKNNMHPYDVQISRTGVMPAEDI